MKPYDHTGAGPQKGPSISKKMSVLFAIIAVPALFSPLFIPDGYFREATENDLVRSVKNKVDRLRSQLPEDRVYLQLDKPFYEPGDDIWISAWVREGAGLKASEKSDIVHIELIDPKGTIEKKITLIAKNGKASGDFP